MGKGIKIILNKQNPVGKNEKWTLLYFSSWAWASSLGKSVNTISSNTPLSSLGKAMLAEK